MDMNEYSLFFDGAIILIILLSALIGRKKGIVDTAIKLVGLIAAIFLAVTFTGKFADLLSETPLRDLVYGKIIEAMNSKTSEASGFLPWRAGEFADGIMTKGKELLAQSYTDTILTMLSFVVIVVVVLLVVFLLRMMLKKGKDNSRIIGTLDGLTGMLLGICKGFIIACLFVALIIPVTTLFSPLNLPQVIKGLNSSFIARWIYDTNPLFLIIKNIIIG